jgi:hypothetical protein
MYSDEEFTALYPPGYYAYQDERKGSFWKERTKKLLGYWPGTKGSLTLTSQGPSWI